MALPSAHNLRNLMIKALLTTAALLWTGVAAAACDPSDTTAAIDHLVESVRASDAEFIRNGRSYDGDRAARHMQRKAEHFDERIDSPESFIELAATRSELTGRPYRVRFADGKETTTARWLGVLLAQWRAGCGVSTR